MKQLLILSGKGGTGKTTLVSSFIKLKNAKMYADCDVDAPNLHLVVSGQGIVKHSDFYGMQKAYINQEMCVSCGKCYTNCRFDAIEKIVESTTLLNDIDLFYELTGFYQGGSIDNLLLLGYIQIFGNR